MNGARIISKFSDEIRHPIVNWALPNLKKFKLCTRFTSLYDTLCRLMANEGGSGTQLEDLKGPYLKFREFIPWGGKWTIHFECRIEIKVDVVRSRNGIDRQGLEGCLVVGTISLEFQQYGLLFIDLGLRTAIYTSHKITFETSDWIGSHLSR